MLNLVAILAFFGAVLAAVLRLRRRLSGAVAPRSAAAAGAGDMACAACGAPASAMETFNCPSCRRDVREMGLARRRGVAGRSRPLWHVMTWTALLTLAAGILTPLIAHGLGRDYRDSEFSRHASLSSDRVELTLSAHGTSTSADGELTSGELAADLWVKGRGFATLEVQGPPLRGRIVDAAGRELAAEAPLDLPLVLRWYAAAGADPDSAEVDHHARDELVPLAGALQQTLQVPPTTRPRPGLISSSSGGGSSSHSGRVGPAWLGAAALASWTVVWLAGIFFLTRQRQARAPAKSVADTKPTDAASGADVAGGTPA